jgi:hypothetical protein
VKTEEVQIQYHDRDEPPKEEFEMAGVPRKKPSLRLKLDLPSRRLDE